MYLGIHLGHDASASLFNEKGLIKSVIQERHTGIRHDYGINIKTIDLLLDSCNLEISDIKSVGISSTQQMPAINQSPKEIRFIYKPTALRSKVVRLHGLNWLSGEYGLIVDRSSQPFLEDRFKDFIENNLVKIRNLPREIYDSAEFISFADPMLVNTSFSSGGKNLNSIVTNGIENLRQNKQISALRLSEDLTISIRGIHLPATYWSHHACHASSNAALYGDERLIFTHDGGQGFQSGGLWQFQKGQLELLTLHELELGQLYDFFAFKLGLGSIGGAGKLMGLAAYGKGILFQHLPFYGTPADLVKQFAEYDGSKVSIESHYNHLWVLCLEACKDLQLDISRIGEAAFVTEEAPVEIASFIQRMLEKTLQKLIKEVHLNFDFESIGLSGGIALNCPSNSKIFEESNFKKVLIEPHCEDGGCSVGAAQLAYVKDKGKFPNVQAHQPTSGYAYKGIFSSEEAKISKSTAKRVAELICQNKTVGIFFNNSEIGPRALGHRSIVANPKYQENWHRVNGIKGREHWRPFAPAVLKSHLKEYFTGGPDDSPFMLFNYKVKSEFKKLFPAITHADGTSRVQTITQVDNPLFEILCALVEKKEHPVIMNTSFNGPGQPIIESKADAISFFENTNLDAVLLDDVLLEK